MVLLYIVWMADVLGKATYLLRHIQLGLYFFVTFVVMTVQSAVSHVHQYPFADQNTVFARTRQLKSLGILRFGA
ncbi:hypothetical protein BDW66DRAFT_126899 [Aspergillus desertorum]